MPKPGTARPKPLTRNGVQRTNAAGELAWRLRVRDKRSGRQPEVTFYGTEAAAIVELEKMRSDVLGAARPAPSNARNRKLGPVAVDWLKDYQWKVRPEGANKGVRREETTWRNAKANVSAYIVKKPIAGRTVVSLDYDDCYRHIAGLRVADGSREASPATKEKAASVLRMVLAYAKAQGIVAHSPAAELPTSWGHSRKKTVIPSLRQVESLAAAMDEEWGAPHGDIVRVFAYTALRWEDLSALLIDKVDLERRQIVVDSTSPSGTGRSKAGTKTTEARYPVIIDQAVEPLKRLMKFAADHDSEYVMCGARGGPLSYGLWRKHLNKARAESKVPYTAHDLRHVCISLLIAGGADLRVVADQAGHARTTMTESVYRHAISLAKAGKLAAELTRAVTRIEVDELDEKQGSE